MVSGFYEYVFRANARPVADSGCGGPAVVWPVASETRPAAVRGSEEAGTARSPTAAVPPGRSTRPVPDPVVFFPAFWRMEASQAWAIIESVM